LFGMPGLEDGGLALLFRFRDGCRAAMQVSGGKGIVDHARIIKEGVTVVVRSSSLLLRAGRYCTLANKDIFLGSGVPSMPRRVGASGGWRGKPVRELRDGCIIISRGVHLKFADGVWGVAKWLMERPQGAWWEVG
jgi:hypothetical protein